MKRSPPECPRIEPLPLLEEYSYFDGLPVTFEPIEPLLKQAIDFADSKLGDSVKDADAKSTQVECRCSVCRVEHGATSLVSANTWVGSFQEEFLRQADVGDVEFSRFRMTNESGSSIDASVEQVVYVDYSKR